MSSGDTYAFGPFILDPDQHHLSRDGQPIRLTPKAFELLQILVEAHGQLVHKSTLMARLWPETFVEESSLTFNIHQLRKALGDADAEARYYIENVPKKGYRFCAPTTVVRDERPESNERAAPVDGMPAQQLWWSSAGLRFGVAVIVIVLAAVAALVGFRRSRERARGVEAVANGHGAAVHRRRAVAVFELKSISGQPDVAWISTAIAEMLSTDLGAGGKIRIIPRENLTDIRIDTSAAKEEGQAATTLRQIGRHVGADLIVLGSYSAVGVADDKQIRIDARIEDVRTGDTVAAVAESGGEVNLFGVVSRVGSRLRDALQLGELSPVDHGGVRASMPATTEARKLYIEGLSKLQSTEALAAKPLLQKVVDADPEFPLGHAKLAEAWYALGYDSNAKIESKRAFDLSGSLSQEQRLWVEAGFRKITHEWVLAADIYRRLLDFFPDDIECAIQLADVQTLAGTPKLAVTTVEQFRRWPSPLGDDWRLDLAEAAAAQEFGDLARQLEAAERAEKKALSANAHRASAYARLQRGRAYKGLGRVNEAFTLVSEAKAFFLASNDQVNYVRSLVDLANYMRDAGRTKERKAIYEEARSVYERIGNKKGEAQILNDLAGMLEDDGELAAAKRDYEASLAIRRDIDDRSGVATSLNNLGDVCQREGDLASAERLYREALAAFQGADLRAGAALALSELGEVRRLRGDLANARPVLQRSVSEWRTMKARTFYAAGALVSLGDVLLASGDLKGARTAYAEGLSFLTDSATKDTASEYRLHMASLMIEDGRPSEAESVSRASKQVFHEEGHVLGEVAADMSLAKALLAQGNTKDAASTIQEARQLPARAGRLSALDLDIVQAHIDAATPGREARAVNSLHQAKRLAQHYGSVAQGLEIDLALCNLLAKAGNPDATRTALTALRREADARGFALVARKADEALRRLRSE